MRTRSTGVRTKLAQTKEGVVDVEVAVVHVRGGARIRLLSSEPSDATAEQSMRVPSSPDPKLTSIFARFVFQILFETPCEWW